MPLIITLSHANAPKEQRLPNHPRSVLLCSVPLYVKHCADDKVDLVMLAHHPAAWKKHKYEHVCARTQTHTLTQALSSHMLFFSFLSPALSFSPPHEHTHTNTRTSEGPMYVRALSKHSYGCYMLQLLPDGLGENVLRLLFH